MKRSAEAKEKLMDWLVPRLFWWLASGMLEDGWAVCTPTGEVYVAADVDELQEALR